MSKRKSNTKPFNLASMDQKRQSNYSIYLTILSVLFLYLFVAADNFISPVALIAGCYCAWYVRNIIKHQNQDNRPKAWTERPENRYLLIVFGMFICTGALFSGGNFICLLALVWLFTRLRKRVSQSNPVSLPQEEEMDDDLPDLPKAKPEPSAVIRPEYARALAMLKNNLTELESREESVSDFLDDYFAGSTISKSRYLQVIQNAKHVLKTNYEKASQAVKLFGNSVPTPERLEIMEKYVRDSQDVVNNLERVINELIKVQQSDVLNDGSKLDVLLDDLAATTSYYQKQQGSH